MPLARLLRTGVLGVDVFSDRADEEVHDEVGVRIHELRREGVDAGEALALGRHHEHGRAGAGQQVLEVGAGGGAEFAFGA